MLDFDAEVIEAAGQPFPAEPIRTLDAIHLAFWAQAHRTLGEVTMLSLDRRVRAVTRALGGHLAPEAVD